MVARASFKQADVTRAVKAIQAAGLPVAKVVVREGEISILTVATFERHQPERNPWHDEPKKS